LSHHQLLSKSQVVAQLKAEQVVAIAAEGVWGLSCLVHSTKAINHILALKKRALAKGFIVGFSRIDQIIDYFNQLSKDNQQLLVKDFDTPTTVVLPHLNYFNHLICGGRATVAIRKLKPCALKDICELIEQPLLSTSANISGHSAIVDKRLVMQQFPNVAIFDDTPNLNGQSSRIYDSRTKQYLR